MSEQTRTEGFGSGCVTLILAALVIGVVVSVAISLAALIDPFAWMPPVAEIWEDCNDDWRTSVNECNLHTRFPGFWGHAIANFTYALLATGLPVGLARAVRGLRQSRPERFDDQTSAERYGDARAGVVTLAALGALVACLPIIVAVA